MPGDRTQALLGSLAATPGEGVSEGRLIEEIWGDDVPANPTKALQVVVSRARSATAPEVVLRTPRGYRLAEIETDLARLAAGHDRAAAAEQAGDWVAVAEACADVRSTVISEAGDGELRRLRLHALGLRHAVRAMLGRALSALGRHEEALPLLEAAGWDEPTLVALLRSEAAVRGVPAALERYDAVRIRLADDLGVDPGPELAALHADLLARDHPVRDGLLFEATRLIGREDDVAALSQTIRGSRVTSIVGAGGLGKTRLAHVLGRLAEQPVVHFVELAGVTSPDGVAVEVADVLAVRESVTDRLTSAAARRTDLVSRIVDQVSATPALLVLDNCEHLVEAVADLVSVLVARTPQLRVLTTSRAPLGIAAERVYQLPQLSPDDAADLFAERASAARPGARLDPAEVRSLVARLDGLPLAVELAAAKVRVMSVAEIARRLDDRFALLRGGARDAPERHQTLLAVIDWSWNLLDEPERTALRRLSVFRDGFSLEGADAVVGGDALTSLTRLVEQSLVTVMEGPGGLRYRLLETVREFGQAQLVAAGDDAATAARLRAWGVGFSVRADDELFGPRQVETMSLIRAEEGNLVDVLRQALGAADADAVVALMACLSQFWTVEGSHLKVVGLAHEVEDVIADAEVDRSRRSALRTALTAIVLNSMIFSDVMTARALARLERLGPGADGTRTAAQVRVLLAAYAGLTAGDLATIDRLCEDPDPRVRQQALQWASQLHENSGDLDGAYRSAIRARDLADGRDGPWSRALVCSQLAGVTIQVGRLEEALGYAIEALPVMEALGATEDVAGLKTVVALAAMAEGRYDDAARLFDEIEADDAGSGVFGAAIVLLCGRAELDLARGRVERGLLGYRDAAHTLATRSVPGLAAFAGFEPWVLYPQAAALSAHVRHGRREEALDLRLALAAKLPHLLGGSMDGSAAFMDYPIVGSALFALAEWELAEPADRATAERAVRLLVHADRFGYNRQLPSLSWAGGVELAEAVLPGGVERVRSDVADRKPHELRDATARLVAELG